MHATSAPGWGIERIQVVDVRLAQRFRAALWSHTLRRPNVLRQLVPVLVVATMAALVCAWHYRGGVSDLTWWPLSGLPAVTLAAYVWTVLVTMRRHESWLSREVVPGRFIAVTVGQESLRVRDHDSSVEYSYSLITAVHQYGDVVVIEHSPSFWTLPLEVFELHELSVIRARAGRAFLPSHGTTEHLRLDDAGVASSLRLPHRLPERLPERLGRLVR